MDPDGHFVDAFRKTNSEDDVVERVKKEIAQWDEERGKDVDTCAGTQVGVVSHGFFTIFDNSILARRHVHEAILFAT